VPVRPTIFHEHKIRVTQELSEQRAGLPSWPGGRLATTWSALIASRDVTESPNLLPLLIQVLAAFSKAKAKCWRRKTIPRSLLRSITGGGYSELRQAFPQRSPKPDLGLHGKKLAAELAPSAGDARSIYDSFQGRHGAEQVVTFYSYEAARDAAAGIDIVYQLHAGRTRTRYLQQGQSPLESLTFGTTPVTCG